MECHARPAGEIEEWHIIKIDEVVSALYVGLLGRLPKQDEIDERALAYASGHGLVKMAEEIAGSAEGEITCIDRFVKSFRSQAETQGSDCWLTIRASDVMSVVADTYETCLMRRPGFDEVLVHFDAIARGASVHSRLQSIRHSAEANTARARRQDFDPKEIFAKFLEICYIRCLHRSVSSAEVDIWYNEYRKTGSYVSIITSLDDSEEATSKRASRESVWDDGVYVQLLYEFFAGRGASPFEIEHYCQSMASGMTRNELLNSFFTHFGSMALSSDVSQAVSNDPSKAFLFGKSKTVTIDDWKERAAVKDKRATLQPFTRFDFVASKTPLVSVITSLYRGGRYLEAFLKNITSQTIFEQHCELLIFDANSPEGEFEKSKPYLERFPNIRYERYGTRIGIYEAWNLAIKSSRGEYLTNANLDDCRRQDSLELQAATLDALPFVDVTYQDVLYSFEENASFDDIQRFDFKTELPIISRYNLLEFNSPHNGPMWRKSLHDELGYFDARLQSAGDYEFWMRCALAKKTFYKINEAHVAYFVNPQGLSTRADTRGAVEANTITKAANRRLISPFVTMSNARFSEHLEKIAGFAVDGTSRYAMVQQALRKLSSASRTTRAREFSQ